MTLSRKSTLKDVVGTVARQLRESGIRAVLTGGACASLYTGGKYQSSDLDFVLESAVRREELDSLMEGIGFDRVGDHYEHPTAPYFVEFPPGPLGIGSDIRVRPAVYRIRNSPVRTLSATDSCRDRLAAFYHWGDRQSLETAVQIALTHRVRMATIRRWSAGEGAATGFSEFEKALRRARRLSRKG